MVIYIVVCLSHQSALCTKLCIGFIFFLYSDLCWSNILFLQLIEDVNRHMRWLNLGKRSNIEAVHLSTPIIVLISGDHDLFPWV